MFMCIYLRVCGEGELTDCGCGSVTRGLDQVVSIKCNSTILAQNPSKVSLLSWKLTAQDERSL